MKRVTALIAALTFGASVLTGCSGGTEAYCDALKETAEDFEALDAGNFDNFDDFVDRSRDLASEAPDEVADEWNTVADALDGLVDALAEAGVEPGDMAGIQAGDVPEGVDQAKLAESLGKIQALGSEEVTKATETISTHAKDECGVDLQ